MTSFYITCSYCPSNVWMSFVSWLSIGRIFPDSKRILVFNRKEKPITFNWINKLRPDCLYFRDVFKVDGLIITATTVAVRENKFLGPVSVKSNDFASLVDYSEGCGKLDVNKVADNRGFDPFLLAYKRFATESMTVNEVKVLELFDQVSNLYRALS